MTNDEKMILRTVLAGQTFLVQLTDAHVSLCKTVYKHLGALDEQERQNIRDSASRLESLSEQLEHELKNAQLWLEQ